MTTSDFIPASAGVLPDSGVFRWQAPSNIALVKYWGKKPGQIPMNPSVSFTLDACATRTELRYQKTEASSDAPSFEVFFDGAPAPHFREKIQSFFERILPYQPFLSRYEFEIHTENTFPHSSGIASSASGMSALALCLVSLEQQLLDAPHSERDFTQKSSFLSRLGSGSACRSIEGPLVLWGRHEQVKGSSDEFGLKLEIELASDFVDFQDCILLVDKDEKQVSSTAGHNLMNDHPYAGQRFKTANQNIPLLVDAMQTGDMEQFIGIVESEALQLHAMMMTSRPYFILMKPNTLETINRIWAFRRETGVSLCFTLDAGANVHLLFPKSVAQPVRSFIDAELAGFCVDNSYIQDHTGLGANKLV